jgi:hypothetical protein
MEEIKETLQCFNCREYFPVNNIEEVIDFKAENFCSKKCAVAFREYLKERNRIEQERNKLFDFNYTGETQKGI